MKYTFSLIIFTFISLFCWSQEFHYSYTSFRERDPLRPLVNESGEIIIKEKKEMGDFILQGIIYSSGDRQVIMNNELFREGDTFEGYTIKKIDSHQVIFEKEGNEFILKWEGG